jgi:hypothetical protein
MSLGGNIMVLVLHVAFHVSTVKFYVAKIGFTGLHSFQLMVRPQALPPLIATNQ